MNPTIFAANKEKDSKKELILSQFDPSKVDVTDKYILLTGATNGIGYTLAIALAKAGAIAILLDKSIPALESLYNDIMQINPKHEPFLLPVDLSGATLDDYIDIADKLAENTPHIDGIIHNAAMLDGLFGIMQIPPEILLKQIHVNLIAPIWLTQALFGQLTKSKKPTLLFADHQEATGDEDAYWNSYGIAKLGLMKFMNQMAFEYSENYNIHAYGYNTGWVDTGLSRVCYPDAKPEWLQAENGKIATEILKLFTTSIKNGSIINLDIS